jgi:hypothetical protein
VFIFRMTATIMTLDFLLAWARRLEKVLRNNWDIIVRWAGFEAQETSCNLNKIKRRGAAWLASFSCSGAGVSWLEEDEIRANKNAWTLEAKIKNVWRVGDPIRYCLANKC